VEILPGQGRDAIVLVDCGGNGLVAGITRRSVSALGLAPGQNVYAVVKAVAFDRGSIGGQPAA
jgi:molybdate transport system ATP-binding protein